MKNTNPVGRPYVDHYAPKQCISCSRLFGRRTKSNGNGRNESKEEFEKRMYCSDNCKDRETCQLHELVRIRVGGQYYSITGRLTDKQDEAIVYHPDNTKMLVMELTNRYKGEKVYLEKNRA